MEPRKNKPRPGSAAGAPSRQRNYDLSGVNSMTAPSHQQSWPLVTKMARVAHEMPASPARADFVNRHTRLADWMNPYLGTTGSPKASVGAMIAQGNAMQRRKNLSQQVQQTPAPVAAARQQGAALPTNTTRATPAAPTSSPSLPTGSPLTSALAGAPASPVTTGPSGAQYLDSAPRVNEALIGTLPSRRRNAGTQMASLPTDTAGTRPIPRAPRGPIKTQVMGRNHVIGVPGRHAEGGDLANNERFQNYQERRAARRDNARQILQDTAGARAWGRRGNVNVGTVGGAMGRIRTQQAPTFGPGMSLAQAASLRMPPGGAMGGGDTAAFLNSPGMQRLLQTNPQVAAQLFSTFSQGQTAQGGFANELAKIAAAAKASNKGRRIEGKNQIAGIKESGNQTRQTNELAAIAEATRQLRELYGKFGLLNMSNQHQSSMLNKTQEFEGSQNDKKLAAAQAQAEAEDRRLRDMPGIEAQAQIPVIQAEGQAQESLNQSEFGLKKPLFDAEVETEKAKADAVRRQTEMFNPPPGFEVMDPDIQEAIMDQQGLDRNAVSNTNIVRTPDGMPTSGSVRNAINSLPEGLSPEEQLTALSRVLKIPQEQLGPIIGEQMRDPRGFFAKLFGVNDTQEYTDFLRDFPKYESLAEAMDLGTPTLNSRRAQFMKRTMNRGGGRSLPSVGSRSAFGDY